MELVDILEANGGVAKISSVGRVARQARRAAREGYVIRPLPRIVMTAMAAVIFIACKRPATPVLSPSCTAASVSWLSRAQGLFYQLRGDASAALTPLPILFAQVLLSFAIVATYLLIFWLCAQAVHAPLSAASALLAIPLVLTAMTIPLSVGGLGLRESAAAVIWPLLSMSANDGVAAALLYGAVVLFGSLPGVAVLIGPGSTKPESTLATASASAVQSKRTGN